MWFDLSVTIFCVCWFLSEIKGNAIIWLSKRHVPVYRINDNCHVFHQITECHYRPKINKAYWRYELFRDLRSAWIFDKALQLSGSREVRIMLEFYPFEISIKRKDINYLYLLKKLSKRYLWTLFLACRQ